MGKVMAVNISVKRGTQKVNVHTVKLIENYGLENDAHAGNWHRQVSLLSYEKIEEFKAKGAPVKDGAFGENLIVQGFDFKTLPVGTRLKCNDVILEITQIGKQCHNGCEIFKIMGDCIMPREGVFARVIQGGVISEGDEMVYAYYMAKKNLVNWSDCMPLSAAIFNQHDDYFLDSIRDSIEVRTNSYNYGLLPARQNRDGENGIRISQHVTGHIEVRLKYCDAVTASGIRIQFDATETGSELVKNYSVESDTRKNITQWDIILSVDPFHRVGSGDPNPEEVPPRHPNALPSYRLFVMPKGEINISELGSHYLTIGRIRKDAERFMVDHPTL